MGALGLVCANARFDWLGLSIEFDLDVSHVSFRAVLVCAALVEGLGSHDDIAPLFVGSDHRAVDGAGLWGGKWESIGTHREVVVSGSRSPWLAESSGLDVARWQRVGRRSLRLARLGCVSHSSRVVVAGHKGRLGVAELTAGKRVGGKGILHRLPLAVVPWHRLIEPLLGFLLLASLQKVRAMLCKVLLVDCNCILGLLW